MERKISHHHVSLTLFALLATLLSQNLIIPVISLSTTTTTVTVVEDQKNYYYSPDPHAGSTPPTGSHKSPPSSHDHGGHGSKSSPTTPSAGGNCGTPPTPNKPSTDPKPSKPPSSRGGGGGGRRSGYYNSSPPPTPITVSPPTTPVDPGTPNIPSPSPFIGGTCDFWRTHPGLIWGVVGWWGTLGSAFGVTSSSNVPAGFSSGLTLPQALSNTRTDGLGALYREGTASFLNSLVNHKFPYTTNQVKDRFLASLHSNKAAAAQAKLFKMANEQAAAPSYIIDHHF